jgi:hypothetical protein
LATELPTSLRLLAFDERTGGIDEWHVFFLSDFRDENRLDSAPVRSAC